LLEKHKKPKASVSSRHWVFLALTGCFIGMASWLR
jgi:hypothetical protein